MFSSALKANGNMKFFIKLMLREVLFDLISAVLLELNPITEKIFHVSLELLTWR